MELDTLSGDSDDIYLQTKLETYLKRPTQLDSLTYPEFYQWWRSATQQEQKNAAQAAMKRKPFVIKCKGADDFSGYLSAKLALEAAEEHLAHVLTDCDVQIESGYDLLALKQCMQTHGVAPTVIDTVVRYYIDAGIDVLNDGVHDDVPVDSLALAEEVVEPIDFDNSDIVDGLSSYHWLMGSDPRDEQVSVLDSYSPGSVLADRVGHYWIRRAKMVITRHRFISSVGDDTEKFYQQKFLVTVPITEDHEVVLNPPHSWVELCAQNGMCDGHLDALSCLHSAISRGFHTDQLRSLAVIHRA